MFMPLTVKYITQQINKLKWITCMQRLEHLYIFKISICKIVSSNMSNDFLNFCKIGIKLITIRTFVRLVDVRLEQYGQWMKQIQETCQIIRGQYCKIIGKIQKDKIITVIDLLNFITCLLAREFLQQMFKIIKSNKTDKKSIKKEQENISYENKQNQDQLLVEQYAFILITYQTTGNFVSPYAFQHLRRKYIQRVIYQQKSTNNQEIIQSLKYIKENINTRNQIYLYKVRNREFDKIYPYMKQISKTLYQQNHYAATKKAVKIKKSKKKIDSVSQSLNQFLAGSQDNASLQKINAKMQKIKSNILSKSTKMHFNLDDQRFKSISNHKRQYNLITTSKQGDKKFLLNFKPDNKIQLSLQKRKQYLKSLSNSKQIKDWPRIVEDLKKKSNKIINDIQKFKSFSRPHENGQKQLFRFKKIKSVTQKQELNQLLPNIKQSQNIYPNQRNSSTLQLKSFQKILFKVQQNNNLILTKYKFHQIYEPSQKQEKPVMTQFNKLRKKVLDVKIHKRAFDQKCKQRKTVLAAYRN